MSKTRPAVLYSCALVAVLAGSTLAWGQAAATPADTAPPAMTPATSPTPAPGAAVRIFVTGVTGKVRFRASTEAGLEELKPGQELKAGAEIFTAPNSIVQLQIGSGQVFTIDRLGRVIILDTGIVNGKETTTLQMPYGRVKFEITSTQVANDVHIQSPDATLAVKGTIGIMEVIPGQPTSAWGGDLNTGVFNVMYTGGINTDVGKNHKTKKDQPAVGGVEDEETYVETNDPKTRDPNSRQSARWTPSLGRFDDGSLGGYNHRLYKFPPPPGPDDKPVIREDLFFDLSDPSAAAIHQNELDGFSEAIAHALNNFPGDPVGSAVLYDGDTFTIVGMDSGFNETALTVPTVPYGTITLSQWRAGAHQWTTYGTIAPNDGDTKGFGGNYFDGLGALHDVLYTSGYSQSGRTGNTGNVGIFELSTPSSPGGAIHADQRMSFPMIASSGGLTGANDRGTMFMTGQFSFHNQLGVGGLVLLEVDPRTNYIANAWSVAAGDFDNGQGTTLAGTPAIPNVGTDFVDSGAAYSHGQVVITGTHGKGEAAEIHFLPEPAIETQPHVTANRSGSNAIHSRALAGEGGRNTLASAALTSPAHPLGSEYGGVDPIWMGTAYSRQAAHSRTFQRMVATTVLGMATDPAACHADSHFYTNLQNALGDHYGEVGGVGQAIQQFHGSVGSGSPCALPTP